MRARASLVEVLQGIGGASSRISPSASTCSGPFALKSWRGADAGTVFGERENGYSPTETIRRAASSGRECVSIVCSAITALTRSRKGVVANSFHVILN